LYGVLTLTQAIKPQLAKNARIVVLSSRGGQLSGELEKPFAPAYCISKTAVNMLTQALASELEGMCVNCMCPGWVKTDLGGSSAPKSIEEGADTAIWLCLEAPSFTGKYIAERKEIPW
jgi:NAD(P)-dependent dehydrogenase (short-subunit alcohol dehydrogenase family)